MGRHPAAPVLAAAASAMCVALVGCGGGTPVSTPFWDGQLPFDEREGIEDYQGQVEPLVQDILTRLEPIGLGHPSLTSASELQECGTPQEDAYEVDGSHVKGGPVDADAAVQAIDAVLAQTGFTEKTDHRDAKIISISWYDTGNGGYFDLTIAPESHTALTYGSGCRPTDGSTTDRLRDRTTPPWESALTPLTEESGQSQR